MLKHFDIGAVCEQEYGFDIETDYWVDLQSQDSDACPHAKDFRDDVYEMPVGRPALRKRAWTVPRVVIAYNEGGYNCTVVCVDCLLAALETMP